MYERVSLMNHLRKLWEQHVMWTRSFIISVAHDLKDLDLVTKRLLENPVDFANVLRQYYGDEIAKQFENLLTEHLLIAGDLVKAAKAGDTAKVASTRTKWYDNAAQIAKFLASINPHWDEEEWKFMLDTHLQLIEQEVANRLQGRFAEDISDFELIEEEALEMADLMTLGIIEQFNL